MKNQSIFYLVLFALLPFWSTIQAQNADAEWVYFGAYTRKEGHVDGKGRGIYSAQRSGKYALGPLMLADSQAVNPSFLTLSADGRFLYAVEETGPGADSSGHLMAFAVENGRLRLLNRQSVRDHAPCYVRVDRENRFAFTANYAGSITLFPIVADGSLLPASDVQRPEGAGPTPRQTSSHPHSVVLSPDERFVYAPDLGTDKIWIFRVDAERLKLLPAATGFTAIAAGAGPRHMAFHPRLPYAYVVNELNNTVTALRWNGQTGALDTLQSFYTLPSGFSGSSFTADIHLTPDGKFLYVSNRGHDSIAGFKLDPKTGLLAFFGTYPTGGNFPRGFGISPDGKLLLAGNQNTSNLRAFRITRSGELRRLWDRAAPTPVCIRFR